MKHSYVCQDALVRYSNEEFDLCAHEQLQAFNQITTHFANQQ